MDVIMVEFPSWGMALLASLIIGYVGWSVRAFDNNSREHAMLRERLTKLETSWGALKESLTRIEVMIEHIDKRFREHEITERKKENA